MSQFVFNVAMSCGGCSKAVTNALAKAEYKSVVADLDSQTVTVTVDAEFEEEDLEDERQAIFEIIKKTGKRVTIPDAEEEQAEEEAEAEEEESEEEDA
ncbi:Cytosolic copper metallochaperone [Coemansia spiralis]|nr:Cytosolic copper metallochaperone [Coemansia spiralis]